MDFKFKKYWRKTGLSPKWGNKLLNIVKEKNPKHFLEIGVFCGVTSRNICEFLNLSQQGNFTYTGVDIFGDDNSDHDEIKPKYISNQKTCKMLMFCSGMVCVTQELVIMEPPARIQTYQ